MNLTEFLVFNLVQSQSLHQELAPLGLLTLITSAKKSTTTTCSHKQDSVSLWGRRAETIMDFSFKLFSPQSLTCIHKHSFSYTHSHSHSTLVCSLSFSDKTPKWYPYAWLLHLQSKEVPSNALPNVWVFTLTGVVRHRTLAWITCLHLQWVYRV